MADVNLAMVNGPVGSGFSKLAVLKSLRASVADDPELAKMLVDEARLGAYLRHPNVVQTFEVNVHDGEPFIAMEYLDGLPLSKLRRRASKEEIVVAPLIEYVVLADVLRGLHHAHELETFDGTRLSIVHRDVTPHNIFITIDGQVKVVDFGIAKAVGRAALTQHGIVKGKVRYMSPEQLRGDELEKRSDLFSVGIMLWEAATGQRFWEGREEYEIARALQANNFNPSPRSVCPSVSEAIDAVCRKALSFSPADRYPTAEAFRLELEEAIGGNDDVVARRQLGPLVSALTNDDRAKLRRVIEATAQQLEVEEDNGVRAVGHDSVAVTPVVKPIPSSSTPPVAMGASSSSSSSPRSSSPPPSAVPTVPAPPDHDADAQQHAGSSVSRKQRWVVAAFVGLALFGVLLIQRAGTASSEDAILASRTAASSNAVAGRKLLFESDAITRATKVSPQQEPSSSSNTTSTNSVSANAAPAPASAQTTTINRSTNAASPPRWQARWSPRPANPHVTPPPPPPPKRITSGAQTVGKAGKTDLKLDTSDPWQEGRSK
jgi:eukaryotic-like serine/threonine-protein kinase